MSTSRILLSNDDGIRAPGLRALQDALDREEGLEVWTVAPETEQSAMSHALSLHQPLRVKRYGERSFSVSGTPSDSVYCALHMLLPEPPNIVISGINRGPNLGNDVIYSGTVAAAMEGALFGYPSIAMSLCLPENHAEHAHCGLDYSHAARALVTISKSVLADPPASGVTLNVNVLYLGSEPPRGIKLCRLGYTDWSSSVHEKVDPRGKPYYWIGGERSGVDNIPESDNQAIDAGYITITPLHYDLTDYGAFESVRGLTCEGLEWQSDALTPEMERHPPSPSSKRAKNS
jgi:5'-nucleotidase